MKNIFMLLLLFLVLRTQKVETNKKNILALNNIPLIPSPPSINSLPSLETVSSIITDDSSLEDIKKQFVVPAPYKGGVKLLPPRALCGVWWRFYTQNTSLFDIPALSEEILSIDPCGRALWLQDVKTSDTMHASVQRMLQVAHYNLLGHMFFVFYYADQNPCSQKVRNKQGFFIRILSDHGYMQMSTSPTFPEDQSIYWRRFPTSNLDVDQFDQ